ncbi:potassium-transporting ATPase subunit F [Paenibacillus sp. GSMTC-2017]|nr:potassium-transporting ATPase subunit F [Paenibacillus sp. GSMTC-2017]
MMLLFSLIAAIVLYLLYVLVNPEQF